MCVMRGITRTYECTLKGGGGGTLFPYRHNDITYERVDRHKSRISEKLELMHTYEIKQTLQLVM